MSGLDPLDPFTLAARQDELDRAALADTPWLAPRKRARLAPSPFAFLRGSAPLFYEALAARPDLAAGPAGDGSIVGDMHLENVGAYRDDGGQVVFGLNDFDDATIGPLRYDVLRLATSMLLAGRAFHATGAEALDLVEHGVASYLAGRRGEHAPPTPPVVAGLLDRATARTRKDLLDDRAPEQHGKRRFPENDRYHPLPPAIAARTHALLAAYVTALGARAPARARAWTIEDQAFRVAGNGSLGVTRVALLLRDDEGEARLLELKECHEPSPSALFPAPPGHWAHPAERAFNAARALCVSPPRLLAPVALDGLSFVGRRLFPEEDKLSVESMRVGEPLAELVGFSGHLLGAAHGRGVASLGGEAAAWSSGDVAGIVDRAVTLAGALEGAYLAWCRRLRT